MEFKDQEKNKEFLTIPSLDPVLDDDIVVKTPSIDGDVVNDSYKACVVYLLMCMSYAYMELRHYSEALECINEAFEYAGDKVPDLYFRRAQTIYNNKYADADDYNKAIEDLKKAIELKEQKNEKEPIYIEQLDKLSMIKSMKEKDEFDKTICIFVF